MSMQHHDLPAKRRAKIIKNESFTKNERRFYTHRHSLCTHSISLSKKVGRAGFEPAKVKTNRFTVCPRWPLEYLPDALLSA